MKDVFLHFRHSFKCQQSCTKLQQALEIPKKHLLNTCKTRWLALRACRSRFLEQLTAIIEYFKEEAHIMQNADIISLHQKLENPFNIMYLKFLEYVLPFIVNQNKEFLQAENLKIQFLYKKMEQYLKCI